jgi:hypothetical protein
VTKPDGNGTDSSRNALGHFAKGNKLGGRKLGSRNKLSEAFLQDLHRAWLKHGRKVLDRCATSAPEAFLRACVSTLPRAVEIEARAVLTNRTEMAVEITDFRQAWDNWGRVIGVDQKMIEHIEDDDAEQPDTA